MLHDADQYQRAQRVVKTLEKRVRAGIATDEERARARAGAEELIAYEFTRDGSMSEHTRLEVAAVVHRGKPLEPGDPVPGCGCSDCTGEQEVQREVRREHDHRDPLPVERARSVGITTVAARLGIEVNRRGWALCPFHADSDPSLHVNEAKGAAFCNVCGASWDPIGLMMEHEGLEFHDAVKMIAGWAGWIERRAS